MTTRLDPAIEGQVIRNLGGRWSVFEMAILLHHYSSRAPFDRAGAPIYGASVSRLQDHGLLDENKLPTLRGAIFVGMLLQTPVPKEKPDPR